MIRIHETRARNSPFRDARPLPPASSPVYSPQGAARGQRVGSRGAGRMKSFSADTRPRCPAVRPHEGRRACEQDEWTEHLGVVGASQA